MAILQFNGSDVTPDPSSMDVTIQDVSTSDSGRSSKTATMAKIVVASKRSIALSWDNITRSQARAILTQLRSGTDPAYVSVTYDGDPEATGTQTRTFYYGDISVSFQQVWVGTRKRYSKFAFSIIER